MRQSLFDITVLLLNTAPPIARMRGQPAFENWASDLEALAGESRLAPLRETLLAITHSQLLNNDALDRFVATDAQHLPFYTYLEASMTAHRAMAHSPSAAFLLSVVALLGWLRAGGEGLYREKMHYPGLPYDLEGIYYADPRLIPPERVRTFAGWDQIPYILAVLSLKIGAIRGARQIVEHCSDVFMAVSTTWNRSAGELLLRRYQELARQIEDTYSWAVADLAEAFAEEGCRPEEPNFRAEVGALLWSLGLVAESQIFRSMASPPYVPGKRFFQRLIRQSMDALPYDSLLQYLWLEIKDRPPFNIREHTALFAMINPVYDQFPADAYPLVALFALPPSRIYARTLIAWFRGTLDEETTLRYVETTALLRQYSSLLDDRHLVRFRMDCLEYLLAKESGRLAVQSRDEGEVWLRLNRAAASLRSALDSYPEVPDSQSRTSLALCYLIEHLFSQTPAALDTVAFAGLVQAVEANRSARLSYWRQIAPALPDREEQGKAAHFLEQEEQLLTYLRGAYLLTRLSELPRYFDRPTMEFDDLRKVTEDPKAFALTPENGRRQYRQIEAELSALATQMQEVAPEYAGKRLQSQATLDDLLKALDGHRQLLGGEPGCVESRPTDEGLGPAEP